MCLLRGIRRRATGAWTYFTRRRPVLIVPRNRTSTKPVMKRSLWQYQLPRNRPFRGILKRGSVSPRQVIQYTARLRQYMREVEKFVSLEASLKFLEEHSRVTSQLMDVSQNHLCEHEKWIESFHETTRHLSDNDPAKPEVSIDGIPHYVDIRERFQTCFDIKERVKREQEELSMLENKQRSVNDHLGEVMVKGRRPSEMRCKLETEKARLDLQVETKRILLERYQQDLKTQHQSLYTQQMHQLIRGLEDSTELRQEYFNSTTPILDDKIKQDWEKALKLLNMGRGIIAKRTGHQNFLRLCQKYDRSEKNHGGPEAFQDFDERFLRWSIKFAAEGRKIHDLFIRNMAEFGEVKRAAMAAGADPVEIEREDELATGPFEHPRDGKTGSAASGQVRMTLEEAQDIFQWFEKASGHGITASEQEEIDKLSSLPDYESSLIPANVIIHKIRNHQKACIALRPEAEKHRLNTMAHENDS